ncbi:putative RNA helicase [Helianthus annuus]|uniref:RNA helicase n=1 Tax=Helianthus annuus TaxID=4232 RepID=A0A9K3EMS7_HELAN|nr:putative RNA helicase [Helianthus annuus]KAJ0491790.1 putative RNA helicase [Helianthus annuus]
MEPTKIVDGSSLSMVNVGFIACTYAVYVVYMGSTESQDPNEIVLHNHRILSSEPMGVIRVFLTGQDDIDTAVQLITEEAQNNDKSSLVLIVLPLYSGLTRADQDLVFSPSPRGKQKVVISTNIAQTSLMLEGIVYVVDSGFSKQRFYNLVILSLFLAMPCSLFVSAVPAG